MKNEIWKDVPGYEGFYQVSNIGRVKSLKRKGVRNDRIFKPGINSRGYLQCNLRKDGVMKAYNVHQLMAITFLNHKPNGHKIVVDHKNNIQTDNRLENLQVISQRENINKDRNGGTSDYPGVSRNKIDEKWVAQISYDGKIVYLGYFEDELEAAKYYQDALKSIENNTEIKVKKPKFSSKHVGVYWIKNRKKWKAEYYSNGKKKFIGYYLTEEEAHIAYENFIKQLKQQL